MAKKLKMYDLQLRIVEIKPCKLRCATDLYVSSLVRLTDLNKAKQLYEATMKGFDHALAKYYEEEKPTRRRSKTR